METDFQVNRGKSFLLVGYYLTNSLAKSRAFPCSSIQDTKTANRSGNYELDLSTRTGKDESWGAQVNLESINSLGVESGPNISADDMELFFASERSPSQGGYDLWVSERACE